MNAILTVCIQLWFIYTSHVKINTTLIYIALL